jgi:hypothetical protein
VLGEELAAALAEQRRAAHVEQRDRLRREAAAIADMFAPSDEAVERADARPP